jgi:hypothetical protein
MIAAIEKELADKFGGRLEPIKAPLNERSKYARLAKLAEPYQAKGGGQVANKLIREKTGNR